MGLLTALRATTSAGSAGPAGPPGKFRTYDSAADVYQKIGFGPPWRVNFQGFSRKGPQGTPRRPKGSQRESKGAPRCPQGGPKGAKESPRAPKREPRGAQSQPKGAQGHPKGSQREPKVAQRKPKAPQRHPREAKGSRNIFTDSRSTAPADVMLSINSYPSSAKALKRSAYPSRQAFTRQTYIGLPALGSMGDPFKGI